MATLEQPPATRPGASHDRLWRSVATIEVALACAAVALDLLLPALVIAALAGVSLVVRRQGPASLGFHRPGRPGRLAVTMLGFAVLWSLVNVSLTKPVLEHLSGQRQDTSAFEQLQGNLTMLLALLAMSWVLAAFIEELAFRGFLQTLMTELLGGTTYAVPVAVLLVSVVFGFIHTEYGVVGVAVSTIDAIFYSLLRYGYGTVWASVLAHGFIDTLGLVTVFALGPVNGLW